jgi:hypothetical protein
MVENNHKIKGGKKKMETRQVMIQEFVETCPKCGKEVSGTSKKAVEHNFKVHLLSCPSNKENEKK